MILGGVSTNNASGGESNSEAAQAKLEEDLNRFLTLLVAQLQNQDPLDPMDSNEFTQQLVQFANVEQQILQNSNLEKLINLQEANQISTLVDYIGSTVEVEGQTAPLTNGKLEFTYTVPFGAKGGQINITNEEGVTVMTTEADVESGHHTFVWDGTTAQGTQLPDGTYNVLVTALDADNNLMPIEHTVFGNVTGGGAENGQVTLTLGENILVPLESVLSVKESTPPPADP